MKTGSKWKYILPLSLGLIALAFGYYWLKLEGEKSKPDKPEILVAATGEELSKIYCSACHKYPEPSLLDKKSWQEYILPRMSYFIGETDSNQRPDFLFEDGVGGEIVKKAKVFPDQSFLSSPEDWEKITAFYLENAPESLAVAPIEYQTNLDLFSVIRPAVNANIPSTTLLKFASNRGLYMGDANTQLLYHFNQNGKPDRSVKIKEGIVWLEERGSKLFVTTMGSFAPTDAPIGLISQFDMARGGKSSVLIDSLQRPVHSAIADLTGNGLNDVVVCEFAKWTGGLSLHQNLGKGNFKKTYLRKDPGATKVYLHDFNNDSLLDVIALFAQGNEAIYIYYNQGKGQFKEERVLQFSPSNGSSFFELLDYDQDGDQDIVYTAGDNADFKPILKPYHGVYIFENDGANHFKEVFFQPLNGAYAAYPADYDQDGDLDIAAISFFPDYADNPNEGFVYYNNTGDFKMEPYTFNNINLGRWIVMDSGDFDRDGDIDLGIGSLMFEITPDSSKHYMDQWLKNKIPFLLLRNNTK